MSYHLDGRDVGSRHRDVDDEKNKKPLPRDLSHHFSHVAKNRRPNQMKQYYKLFQIPGIGNLAGGLPNVRFFPFDTLEAQAAKPERWTPSPNYPEYDDGPTTVDTTTTTTSSSKAADPQAPARIVVPKVTTEPDYAKKIDLATALQYGQAQGYPPLLSWIRQFTREQLHPGVPYAGGPEVTLVCGSTDGFSKTLDVFVDAWSESRGDHIRNRPALLCESFVYPVILSQAQPRGVQIVPVKADERGMVPGSLEEVLAGWDAATGKRPHLMYMVTLGHNPTGLVLSVERRREIYAICSRYDVIIVEDEPYWYLQFPSAAAEEAKSRGRRPQTLDEAEAENCSSELKASSGYEFLDSLTQSFLSMDRDGRVVRLDTFSKTVAPGCRLGWVTAAPALIEKYIGVSESSTQQPSGFVQAMVAELVMGPQPAAAKSAFSLLRTAHERSTFAGWKMDGWVRWLEGLRGMYERRMGRMCRILDAGCDLLKSSTPVNARDTDWGVITKTPLFEYSWPRGGMFVWIRFLFDSHPLWQQRWDSFAPTSSQSSSASRTRPFHAAAPAPAARKEEGEEQHQQQQQQQQDPQLIGGASLSTALMFYLTHKPHLVLASTGMLFGADDAIRADCGWEYFRLCFAAETEDEVDAATRRFVDGVHAFWKVKDPRVIRKLLEPVVVVATAMTTAGGGGGAAAAAAAAAESGSVTGSSDQLGLSRFVGDWARDGKEGEEDMEAMLCARLGELRAGWTGC